MDIPTFIKCHEFHKRAEKLSISFKVVYTMYQPPLFNQLFKINRQPFVQWCNNKTKFTN